MAEKLSKIWTFLLPRSRVTLLITIMLTIWGLFAYSDIARESSPEIEIPIGIITTVLPGASSGDIETLVTEKIEQEVKTLEKVEKYTSISQDGISIVSVEFEAGSDMIENRQKLQEALDNAEPKLPDSLLDDPRLETASASNFPILSLSLSGDFPLSDLKRFAETIQDEVETVSGVKDALISGITEEKVHIYIDPLKLQRLQLSVEDISRSISSAHFDLPLGNIFVDGEKISIRVEGEFQKVEDFLDLPLRSTELQTIRLSDVATIRREFDELDVETYFSTGNALSPALSIDLIKSEAKTNIAKAVGKSLDIIDELKETGRLPETLAIDITFNNADDIQEDLDRLITSGSQTLILIAIILYFALGWREALLASIAIPLSALMSIGTLYSIGETFNFLSLFALILSIGLLVDNAIIMVEGISESIYHKNRSPLKAAYRSLEVFRWPIITGTSTTIFAFLPMIFLITGVSGQFIKIIPITVTIVLLSSLIVSLFLLPVFAVTFFTFFPPKQEKEHKLIDKMHAWYDPFMRRILASKKKTMGTLAAALVVLVFSIALIPLGFVNVEIFPGGDEDLFTAKIELPKGTKLRDTKEFLPKIDEAIRPLFTGNDYKEGTFKNAIVTIGRVSNFDPSALQGTGARPESEIIGITMNLGTSEERDLTSKEISKILQTELEKTLPSYAEITIGEIEGGPPSGANPIEIRLISEDLDHLERVTDQLRTDLATVELANGAKLKDIVDNRGDVLPQMTWRVERDKLNRYGLQLSSINQTLRAAIEGVRVIQLSEGEDEIDVEMRLDFTGEGIWTDPDTLSVIESTPIRTQNGGYISLRDVATFELGPQRSVIRHRDGKRVVTVGAQIDGKATPNQFTEEMEQILKELPKIPGDVFVIGGDNEESNRLIGEMLQAMILAMFLIGMILVLQFNSFIQPVIILAAIPLSLTAVFIGFAISGTPISFPTMIGIVALAGIIVNDDIVLIDRINHYRNIEGHFIDGLVEGCKSRMQPIFLTSITTVVGMLPLALSDPIWEGLGFAIIYGMSLSTVLTLLLTPCLLLTAERGKRWLIRKVLKKEVNVI